MFAPPETSDGARSNCDAGIATGTGQNGVRMECISAAVRRKRQTNASHERLEKMNEVQRHGCGEEAVGTTRQARTAWTPIILHETKVSTKYNQRPSSQDTHNGMREYEGGATCIIP